MSLNMSSPKIKSPKTNRWIFLKILLLVFLLGMLFAWLINTSQGLHSSLFIIQKLIPGKLTFTKAEGKLSDTLILHDVDYQHPKFSLFAKEISLKNSLWSLLENAIFIPEIKIQEGRLVLSEYSKFPIQMKSLTANILLETQHSKETIHIDEFDGVLAEEPLKIQGNMQISQQQIKFLQGNVHWGNLAMHFKPMQPDNKMEPQFIWEINFSPSQEFQWESHGTIKIDNIYNQWQGKLMNAKFHGKGIEEWQLMNQSLFSYQNHLFTMTPLEFENSHHQSLILKINGDKNKGYSLQSEIPEFALNSPYFKGRMSFYVNITKPTAGDLYGEGALKLSKGHLNIPLPNNKSYQSNYRGGSLFASLEKNILKLNLDLAETEQNTVNASITIPNFILNHAIWQKPLQGSVFAKLNDISIVYLLAPQISKIKGNLEAIGSISGTIENPECNLHAKLTDSKFSIPKQNVTIKNFSANLTGTLPGELTLQSSGILGDNRFYLTGNYDPLTQNGKRTFQFFGEHLRIQNTPNMIIIASPNLNLDFVNSTLYVTGDVHIPEAHITQKEERIHVVTSNDIVHIGNSPLQDENTETLNLVPDIEISMKTDDKIYFKGYGLEAMVTGKLQIGRRLDGLYTGTGRLFIRNGKYRLQGNQYHIQRGMLLYPSGTLLKDPLLDIRLAKRQAQQVGEMGEVGIYVQGTLQNPQFHLYSSDHLQNTEILSRMGLGGSQEEGEDSQRQLLSQTAMFLAEDANPFIENLQSKLHLEEFSVQSAESQKVVTTQGGYDTVLVAGKSLSNNLYLQFIQGMLEPLSMVRLKYFFNPRLTFSVETGTKETFGADVAFSIEQND